MKKVKLKLRDAFHAALEAKDEKALLKLGCRWWDENKIVLLFNGNYFDFVPHGTPVIDIFFKEHLYDTNDKNDNDTRFGVLSFGLKMKEIPDDHESRQPVKHFKLK
jgi:hypothetical protein